MSQDAALQMAAQADPTTDTVRAAFDRLQANRWKMAHTTADERIERVRKLRDAIIARREELCQAVYDDYRKNAVEVELTEVFPTISEANDTLAHLRKWMKPQHVGTPLALFGAHSEVRHEPKGVILILAPWNYPFQLLINPLIAAISAGNCVAVRPSSKVPHTARFIASFLRDLFPPEEVTVFEGDHRVSDALLEMPFDHIFFTGSPRIGTKVMAAAARHLASVTLELGGKSPVIVDRSADMAKTAERVLWGKFVNAGQTCVAPDYMLIHEDKLAPFLTQARRVLGERFGATDAEQQGSANFCRLVSDDHHRGLHRMLDAAVAAGAKIETGGVSRPEERYLAPTLLTGVTEDSPIMKEEIFGPILPILTFRDLDDALRLVRSKPKPLALYVFSDDSAVTERVLAGTTAGGTTVNATLIHLANGNLPFGGVGSSGMGNYHGFYGFRQCSHERAVLVHGLFDTIKLFYPPYTERVKNVIRMAIRWLA